MRATEAPPRPRPQPLACVLGDTDLLRALGMAGVPCVVAAAPGDPARYSRFARAVLDWADAWERPAALLELLERFAAAQASMPALFYEEDRELLLISRQRERLSGYFRFVVPDATLVEDLVDKARFDQWTPIAGAAKALRLDTTLPLVSLWPRLATAGIPVLLQQLIPGPETCIESYHVYVDEQGETVGEFTGRKIRTWPPAYGDSTALVITDAPDVTALGRDLVGRLGLRGVAKFDFKRAPDGRLYLLEINPRFTLWHHLGARAGVNIPALVYADLVGLPRAGARQARAGVRWCKPWDDAASARAAGVPFLRWLPWAFGCEAKRVMAWDDPMPFVRAVLWRGMSRVTKEMRHA